MFKCKPDYEAAQSRINAFWARAETDRPIVQFSYRKPHGQIKPFASKTHATRTDWWLDVEYRADELAHQMESTVWCAESMPVAWPNLGPEILTAMCGAPYRKGL